LDGDFLPPQFSQDYTPSKSTFTREPGRKYVQIKFDENAEHYLDLPVKESTRDDIAKMLFHKLADIIPNIYDVEDETIDRLSELNKKVNWNILKYSIKKWKDDDAWKKEKDLFFEREFEKWFQEKKYKEYSAESPYFSDKKLKAKWIEKKLENIKSTEKDYKEFEKENDISKIEKDFITFRYKWTEARKNADLYEKERDSLNILKYSIKKWEKDSTWKKERDLFFKKEFEKWFQQKNYAKYLAKAPDFSEKAVIEHDKMLNSNLVIEGLLETFGDDIFNENGSYLLQKMEDKMKSKIFIPSYIDVIIQKELLKKQQIQSLLESTLVMAITLYMDQILIIGKITKQNRKHYLS